MNHISAKKGIEILTSKNYPSASSAISAIKALFRHNFKDSEENAHYSWVYLFPMITDNGKLLTKFSIVEKNGGRWEIKTNFIYHKQYDPQNPPQDVTVDPFLFVKSAFFGDGLKYYLAHTQQDVAKINTENGKIEWLCCLPDSIEKVIRQDAQQYQH